MLYEGAYVFYGVILFLLLVVLFFGRKILGAQRWIQFWVFTFQPSELAKLSLILTLAHYFSKKSITKFKSSLFSLNFIEAVIIPLIITVIPMALIYLQPDLGTSLMLGLLFLGILFSSGIKIQYIISLITAGLLSIPFIWPFLKEYQRNRLLVFMNPNLDPLGAGYTIIQSKIAIGSGGLLGKGFASGTQSQLNFLPERHTDFIFSVIAEEWGFVGSIILLVLYFLLMYRIISLVYRIKEPFARFLCLGTSMIIILHVIINIAMTIGICPVVGLPLPFISYGGSNLLVNFTLLGIILNIQKREDAY
jgi:rod shape determining protein RodA